MGRECVTRRPHQLRRFGEGVLTLTREKFDQRLAVYERHQAGERLDAEANPGSDRNIRSAESGSRLTLENGVAVKSVEGVLIKEMNLMTAISGGMSTQMLTDTVNEATADDSVHALMLTIDSSDGEVDGTQQLADAVAACTKPTAA